MPSGLRLKPGSLEVHSFDQEAFELQPGVDVAPARVPVEGRTWRFLIEAEGKRTGFLALAQSMRPALEGAGWTWQWKERGVARRQAGEIDEWLRFGPAGSGEMKVVLVLRCAPRTLVLPRPGAVPVLPAPQQDFPYLPPWPGGKLVSSVPSQSPVDADIDGKPALVRVTFVEKEYALADPPTPHEFLKVYRSALEAAGWEIDGVFRASLIQIQAHYAQEGRDIRVTLRLLGDAMAISVADVGAQRPR